MGKSLNVTYKEASRMTCAPTTLDFRKAKWMKRKRGLKGFFLFLSFIVLVLFFDLYWNMILRVLN